ncbi:MAG: DUF429 domain-containing protein [Candidatus Limnocylindria bacterium]
MRSKKTGPGQHARRAVLWPWFGEVRLRDRPAGVGVDDVLDAYAALWTATRVARREALCIPADPETDARGLRMAIWV